ncbi:hypothetical protein [Candidatus Methanoliparum sp. LAM-1]|uniref:hypothetical protein n=1 Tax=Candidatus Methanoliparum sp. LAM-1 TaxID=2874846 RepID=UPI001E3272CA|nr:hypothetical protein [Candidatus Methanoliparum sp. LAM-1]BDC35481.1 hypothetical protein MTLP_01630 [Candidatus Methanoliparum sp. LAM-1]
MEELFKKLIERVKIDLGVDAHLEKERNETDNKVTVYLWDDDITEVFCILDFYLDEKRVYPLFFPTINIDMPKLLSILKEELDGWEIL